MLFLFAKIMPKEIKKPRYNKFKNKKSKKKKF